MARDKAIDDGRNGPMTTAELNRAFLFFNKNFFDSKLIHPTELRFGKLKDDRHDAVTRFAMDGTHVIVHKQLANFPNFAIIALLHEMAHIHRQDIKTPDGHGMQFDAEIIRLFNSGAYQGLL